VEGKINPDRIKKLASEGVGLRERTDMAKLPYWAKFKMIWSFQDIGKMILLKIRY